MLNRSWADATEEEHRALFAQKDMEEEVAEGISEGFNCGDDDECSDDGEDFTPKRVAFFLHTWRKKTCKVLIVSENRKRGCALVLFSDGELYNVKSEYLTIYGPKWGKRNKSGKQMKSNSRIKKIKGADEEGIYEAEWGKRNKSSEQVKRNSRIKKTKGADGEGMNFFVEASIDGEVSLRDVGTEERIGLCGDFVGLCRCPWHGICAYRPEICSWCIYCTPNNPGSPHDCACPCGLCDPDSESDPADENTEECIIEPGRPSARISDFLEIVLSVSPYCVLRSFAALCGISEAEIVASVSNMTLHHDELDLSILVRRFHRYVPHGLLVLDGNDDTIWFFHHSIPEPTLVERAFLERFCNLCYPVEPNILVLSPGTNQGIRHMSFARVRDASLQIIVLADLAAISRDDPKFNFRAGMFNNEALPDNEDLLYNHGFIVANTFIAEMNVSEGTTLRRTHSLPELSDLNRRRGMAEEVAFPYDEIRNLLQKCRQESPCSRAHGEFHFYFLREIRTQSPFCVIHAFAIALGLAPIYVFAIASVLFPSHTWYHTEAQVLELVSHLESRMPAGVIILDRNDNTLWWFHHSNKTRNNGRPLLLTASKLRLLLTTYFPQCPHVFALTPGTRNEIRHLNVCHAFFPFWNALPDIDYSEYICTPMWTSTTKSTLLFAAGMDNHDTVTNSQGCDTPRSQCSDISDTSKTARERATEIYKDIELEDCENATDAGAIRDKTLYFLRSHTWSKNLTWINCTPTRQSGGGRSIYFTGRCHCSLSCPAIYNARVTSIGHTKLPPGRLTVNRKNSHSEEVNDLVRNETTGLLCEGNIDSLGQNSKENLNQFPEPNVAIQTSSQGDSGTEGEGITRRRSRVLLSQVPRDFFSGVVRPSFENIRGTTCHLNALLSTLLTNEDIVNGLRSSSKRCTRKNCCHCLASRLDEKLETHRLTTFIQDASFLPFLAEQGMDLRLHQDCYETFHMLSEGFRESCVAENSPVHRLTQVLLQTEKFRIGNCAPGGCNNEEMQYLRASSTENITANCIGVMTGQRDGTSGQIYTLQDLIKQQYLSREARYQPERTYIDCLDCGKRNDCCEFIDSIQETNEVLSFVLQRSRYDARRGCEALNEDPVKISMVLVIHGKHYKLQSLLCYSGNARVGHYNMYRVFLDSQGRDIWLRYDSSSLEVIGKLPNTVETHTRIYVYKQVADTDLFANDIPTSPDPVEEAVSPSTELDADPSSQSVFAFLDRAPQDRDIRPIEMSSETEKGDTYGDPLAVTVVARAEVVGERIEGTAYENITRGSEIEKPNESIRILPPLPQDREIRPMEMSSETEKYDRCGDPSAVTVVTPAQVVPEQIEDMAYGNITCESEIRNPNDGVKILPPVPIFLKTGVEIQGGDRFEVQNDSWTENVLECMEKNRAENMRTSEAFAHTLDVSRDEGSFTNVPSGIPLASCIEEEDDISTSLHDELPELADMQDVEEKVLQFGTAAKVKLNDNTLNPRYDLSDQFEKDADQVLQLYQEMQQTRKIGGEAFAAAQGALSKFIKSLPDFSYDLYDVSYQEILQRFRSGIASLNTYDLDSAAAVEVEWPCANCIPYPLAVLFKACSKAIALPLILYVDTFIAVWASILHKEIHLVAQGYTTRSRPWVNNTCPPGVGKNPVLDPFVEILRDVFDMDPGLAPGFQTDDYHFIRPVTDALAMYKFKLAGGQGLIYTAESGSGLCMSFAISQSWDRSKYIDVPGHFMDAAYGGAVSWDTMANKERENRVAKRRKEIQTENVQAIGIQNGQFDITNVVCIFIGQPTMHAKFWARSSCNFDIGFPHRFGFNYGQACIPGDSKNIDFFSVVVKPMVCCFFQATLKTLGPKVPLTSEKRSWKVTTAEDKMINQCKKIVGQLQDYFSGRSHVQETLTNSGTCGHILLWKTKS